MERKTSDTKLWPARTSKTIPARTTSGFWENTELPRLVDAKQHKQQIDRDALLLKNRIMLLKLEEEKATKKIWETEKRTKEILTVKNEKEEDLMRKLNWREMI